MIGGHDIPDQPLPARAPLSKREMFLLHDMLYRLKFFIHMNYDQRDEPPHEDDITAIEEYIERATKYAV